LTDVECDSHSDGNLGRQLYQLLMANHVIYIWTENFYIQVDSLRTPKLFLVTAIVLNLILVTSILLDEERVAGSAPIFSTHEDNATNFSGTKAAPSAISKTNETDANSNFMRIFDGKTLDGWKMSGDGKFLILYDEKAIQSKGGLGILWYSKEKFGNFELKLEWRVASEGDNSGVFVRIPSLGDDHNVAVRGGYEIQINNRSEDNLFQTGAIAGFVAPKNVVLKPPGQWNTMRIQAIDQSYIVFINNAEVIEFTGEKSIDGYLGLQAHDDKSRVSFRNIEVREIN